jgi:iron complex transport system substrate-binding protein
VNEAADFCGEQKIIPKTLLTLIAAVGLIATAVAHWAPPVLAPPLERNGYGRAGVELGSRAYPREAIDADGFPVRIAKPPRRIASQYWSIDEYLYSLVPPERVVAVSQSAYLDGISNVLEQVTKFKPVIATDPERVLRANPDLIIVSSSSRNDFTSLIRSSGIPIYRMFIDFTTLSQIEDYIRLVGYLTGEDDHAEEIAAQFHAEIEHAKSLRRPNARSPRVLAISGGYTYGSGTLFNDIVHTIGAVNPAAEAGLKGYQMVNAEQIARWNPDWIVAGANTGQLDQTRQRILADPGVTLTEAGRSGHVLVLENRDFLPMSPYTAKRMTMMAEAFAK